MPSVEVIVPTYRRAEYLERCLEALGRQTLTPGAVLVVVRAGDDESLNVVRGKSGESAMFRAIPVGGPGVLAALRAGVAASGAEILAFCDDDSEPTPEWLAGLVTLLSPGVGGAGGRDVIPGQRSPIVPVVGVFGPWGRLVGNHHLGGGAAREVDVLKGVNMAFRAEALALPEPGLLRGGGAEVHFELLVCAWAKSRGWRLMYDPAICVGHEGAARHGGDQRGHPEGSAIRDAAYNYVVAVGMFPDRRVRKLVQSLVVGSRSEPSLGRAALGLVRAEREVLRRAAPSIAGKMLGVGRLFRGPGRLLAVEDLRPQVAQEPRPPALGGDCWPPRRDRARVRVALVAHDIHDAGGMEKALLELIRGACARVEFVVVSATLSRDLRPLVDWRRVRVVPRPFPLKFLTFMAVSSVRLARLRVDLVHTTGALVLNRADVATVHFCQAGFREATGGLAPASGPLLRRFNTGVSRSLALVAERWCYRPGRVASLAAVSGGVASELSRHYPSVPVTVTPNGVDAGRFRPDEQARTDSRRLAGLSPEAVVVLFVGGEWERKGLDIAIEGLSSARQSGVESLRLWVVGQGDEARFAELAHRMGVGDQVRFFGFRPDVEHFYGAADIFLLPSRYETFSLVAFEAAACGLPVVATDCSGIRELVGSDVAGLLIEGTRQGVGQALRLLAQDPDLRRRLGLAAHERATSSTWERSTQSVLDLYGALLGARCSAHGAR
jgi:glycosyltransferase involved in cell wall biosynthesis